MLTIEGIAMVCHEANRAYCKALGDTSHQAWEDTHGALRESIIDGVVFHKANAHARPSASHENWLAGKEDAGWKHGDVKDLKAKTHPNMVPFGELPVAEQRKDYLFKFICDALLPMITTEEAVDQTELYIEPSALAAATAGARVPLFHGKYEVDCEAPSGDQPPLTRVTVTGTHGADGVPFPEPKFIAEVVMETKSPAPELVFREKVGSVQRLEEATAG